MEWVRNAPTLQLYYGADSLIAKANPMDSWREGSEMCHVGLHPYFAGALLAKYTPTRSSLVGLGYALCFVAKGLQRILLKRSHLSLKIAVIYYKKTDFICVFW